MWQLLPCQILLFTVTNKIILFIFFFHTVSMLRILKIPDCTDIIPFSNQLFPIGQGLILILPSCQIIIMPSDYLFIVSIMAVTTEGMQICLLIQSFLADFPIIVICFSLLHLLYSPVSLYKPIPPQAP